MPSIFKYAIELMESSKSLTSEPISFQKYVKDHCLKVKGTTPHISVQTFKDLGKELKDANCMVFRLGSSAGQISTSFSLAKTLSGWGDYFLFDSEIFESAETIVLDIDWSSDKFLPFKVIPKLTETSYVNLALVSEVIEKGLGFDKGLSSIPATGHTSCTFDVKPHNELNTVWKHSQGQVEIDSVVVAVRNNKKYLLVIEAKCGTYPESLAKHKIVYPVLSLINDVPEDYTVLPVYLRIVESKFSLKYYIAECNPVEKVQPIAINELSICKACIVELPSNRDLLRHYT
ncbi:DUF6997 domain-containing protein [Shewanella gaetbuli]